jgi:hypothetical protein
MSDLGMRGRAHRLPSNPAAEDRCADCGRSRAWINDNPGPCPGPQRQREQMPIDDPDSPKDTRLPPHRPRRWRGDA